MLVFYAVYRMGNASPKYVRSDSQNIQTTMSVWTSTSAYNHLVVLVSVLILWVVTSASARTASSTMKAYPTALK